MPDLFANTGQQLARDGVKRHIALLSISLLLLIGWISWSYFGRMTQYATTDKARLEIPQANMVQSEAPGRVKKTYLHLGQKVEAGQTLLELQSDANQLQFQQEQSRQAALSGQVAALQRQLEAQQTTRTAEHESGASAAEQASERYKAARAAAQYSAAELKKKESLYQQGVLSELDFLKLQAESKQKQMELGAARAALAQAGRERSVKGSERVATIEAIRTEIERLQGDIETSKQSLQHAVDRYTIRAPESGTIASVADLKIGSYVREGDAIASIVPSGNLRVVADYDPSTAMGRIRPGQPGRMHLDGFPWTEYGSVLAVVKNVGTEVNNGRVRVELDIQPGSKIPMQHGLPGTLDIAVERTSPMSFLLRKAGAYLARPADSQVASQPQQGAAAPTSQ